MSLCVVFIGESRSCVVVVYFCLCVSYRGVILYGDCVSYVLGSGVLLWSAFRRFMLRCCRLVMFFVGRCRQVVVVMLVSCDTLSVARKHSPRHFH